uniref:Uncharacterized protein n=1 Tax=Lepeophtheirus salmonis TaxID=72036 RepID=A0A0K2TL33_LEPSM
MTIGIISIELLVLFHAPNT